MSAHLKTRARGLMSVRADTRDDAASLLRELNTTFAGFRQRNDARLAQVEASIDELAAASSAARLGGTACAPGSPAARRGVMEGFAALVRRGDTNVFAARQMTTQSDPDGGYTIPPQMDTEISRYLRTFSPLRRLASVVTASSSDISFLRSENGTATGWVGEEAERGETDGSQLSVVNIVFGEIYAEPIATQRLLDDSAFDIEAWTETEVVEAFALQEGAAFVNGDGINKPRGFLTLPIVSTGDATRARGQFQYVASGGASDFASSAPADALIDLIYTLGAGYRAAPGVAWLMNSATAGKVRKFKDGQGNYLWQEATQLGQPALLAGYPVEIDENMPDVAANAYPIGFGAWSRAYKIVDRTGVRLLRDPLTRKGYVKFYFTKRVGGAPFDTRAAKFLKIATS